jgi:methylmalonyl-CoA mutase cobalamin-binding domain/chain
MMNFEFFICVCVYVFYNYYRRVTMDQVTKLSEAVLAGDEELSTQLAQKIVEAGLELAPVIERLTETMRILGQQFENSEIYLPDMIMAADAMVAAMEIFEPILQASGGGEPKGIIIFGTAPGDMHEIGKNIVVKVLKSEGYQVIDLGPNVAAAEFVAKAAEHRAHVIGISALMTTTMQGAAEVIKLLEAEDGRAAYKVIVGGAPTNADWAASIGADGWSSSATEAAALVNRLLGHN